MKEPYKPNFSLLSLAGRGWGWVFFLFCLLLPLSLPAQVSDTLRAMWYNVENLFDCNDEAGKDDEEFLPEGTHQWTPYRYWQKQRAVAQVIAAIGDQRLPDLIGLCEVEGDTVLTDLTRRSPLRTAGYQYLVTRSPDERGIDVALLYLPGRFRPLSHQSIPVRGGDRPTRDILYVKGLVTPSDTLNLFLCHLPSRRGGERKSRPFRLLAAQALRHAIDSVHQANPQANVVVMGDFNDNLTDTRVAQAMDVVPSSLASSHLTPGLVSLIAGKQPGTYAYQGRWEVIDHLLVSPSLLNPTASLSTRPSLARIAALPFLLTTDTKFGIPIPHHTYQGPRYLGGFSDHLPIVVDFVKRCE